MKEWILFTIAFIIACFSLEANNVNTKILSYENKIELYPYQKKMSIEVKMRFLHRDSSCVKLLFANSIDIRHAILNNKQLKYDRSGDTLFINVKKIGKSTLRLQYDLPTDSIKSDKIFVLTRSMKWCPFVYDNVSILKSTIIVPIGYDVFTSGALTQKKQSGSKLIYKYLSKKNSGLPYFIAPNGYYQSSKRTVGNINILFYFHNRNTGLQDSIMDLSESTFRFCNQYIGKFRHPSLTYIEFPGFNCAQSMETFILMGSDFIDSFSLYPEMQFWPSHETIHQWFGTGCFISVSQPKGWFLEESLTEYLRLIYIENKFGRDSVTSYNKKSIDVYNTEIKGTAEDVPISQNSPNRVTYCIGPIIFDLLRKKMGEKQWHIFIKKLYSDNFGKVIDYSIFRKILEDFTDQSVINKMEEYLNTIGIPQEYQSLK